MRQSHETKVSIYALICMSALLPYSSLLYVSMRSDWIQMRYYDREFLEKCSFYGHGKPEPGP